ncbi:MAG TPA: AsnC family transcriptional regulator [Thermoplasmata archaeon]|nr:AsnC family transcriptional regulator [Thermoplasmata archaeon]
MDLDRVDIAILRILQEDARASFRDIAKRVGVSVPTVSARVSTLEQLGILSGYRAHIDAGRLNETTLYLLVRTRPRSPRAVAESLAALPETRGVAQLRGTQLLVQATFTRADQVDPFLERLAGIPDVEGYEHYTVTRYLKEEPRAVVQGSLSTTLICFECKGPIEGEPITLKMDGRDHYLCCHSCEKLYVQKYRNLKEGARR